MKIHDEINELTDEINRDKATYPCYHYTELINLKYSFIYISDE